MTPRLFDWLSDDPATQQLLLGDDGVKVYQAGLSPAKVPSPYVTWQVITGETENYLDEKPDMDSPRVRLNCWAGDSGTANEVAVAVRDALEEYGHQVAWIGDDQDEQTGRYVVRFDFQFWLSR